MITQTDIIDPSNTDDNGVYLELTVRIPNENGECTDAMATIEGTNEVLYMCLDASSSMVSVVFDAAGDPVYDDVDTNDYLQRFEIMYRAASNIADTLFPSGGTLFDETFLRFFSLESADTVAYEKLD